LSGARQPHRPNWPPLYSVTFLRHSFFHQHCQLVCVRVVRGRRSQSFRPKQDQIESTSSVPDTVIMESCSGPYTLWPPGPLKGGNWDRVHIWLPHHRSWYGTVTGTSIGLLYTDCGQVYVILLFARRFPHGVAAGRP
jgi:hypothetical protein